jgi:hypothetical protein
MRNSYLFKNIFLENWEKNLGTGYVDNFEKFYLNKHESLDIKISKKNRNMRIFQSKYLEYEFSSIIPCLQDDFNVIYSVSPISNKIIHDQIISLNKSNENSVEYLGNKRIRQLNSPTVINPITISPYSRKSSLNIKSNSAFKNLNSVLLTAQEDKI